MSVVRILCELCPICVNEFVRFCMVVYDLCMLCWMSVVPMLCDVCAICV